MKFSKEAFKQHADRNIKKILSSHIEVLDGKEVTFKNGSKYGDIPYYEVGDEAFHLHPVLKEWCTDERVERNA